MSYQIPQEKNLNGDNVLAIGAGRILENGSKAAMSVKEGDEIIFSRYAGIEVKIDNRDYIVIAERDILAIIE